MLDKFISAYIASIFTGFDRETSVKAGLSLLSSGGEISIMTAKAGNYGLNILFSFAHDIHNDNYYYFSFALYN